MANSNTTLQTAMNTDHGSGPSKPSRPTPSFHYGEFRVESAPGTQLPFKLPSDGSTPDDRNVKHRTSRACSHCNKQKLRCDGVRPCSRCVTLRLQESCEYLPSMRSKTRKKKRKVDPSKQLDEGGSHGSHESNESEAPETGFGEAPVGPIREFARWQKDRDLSVSGARISTLWAEPTDHDRHSISPVHLKAPQSSTTVVDKLTTLPLPGDHNPLAVLAEASANADDPLSPTAPTPGSRHKDDGSEGYYAPLERVLKDEAPHIMTLINVHE